MPKTAGQQREGGHGASVSLASIINAVNPDRIRRIEVEEYAPLAQAETVQSFAVGQPLGVSFPRPSITGERTEDSHGRVAVKTAEISTRRRLPNETLHNP